MEWARNAHGENERIERLSGEANQYDPSEPHDRVCPNAQAGKAGGDGIFTERRWHSENDSLLRLQMSICLMREKSLEVILMNYLEAHCNAL